MLLGPRLIMGLNSFEQKYNVHHSMYVLCISIFVIEFMNNWLD